LIVSGGAGDTGNPVINILYFFGAIMKIIKEDLKISSYEKMLRDPQNWSTAICEDCGEEWTVALPGFTGLRKCGYCRGEVTVKYMV
jgi:hypothetical protein